MVHEGGVCVCVVWYVIRYVLCVCGVVCGMAPAVHVCGVWDGGGQGSLWSGVVRSLLSALGLAGAPRTGGRAEPHLSRSGEAHQPTLGSRMEGGECWSAGNDQSPDRFPGRLTDVRVRTHVKLLAQSS